MTIGFLEIISLSQTAAEGTTFGCRRCFPFDISLRTTADELTIFLLLRSQLIFLLLTSPLTFLTAIFIVVFLAVISFLTFCLALQLLKTKRVLSVLSYLLFTKCLHSYRWSVPTVHTPCLLRQVTVFRQERSDRTHRNRYS
jgi:hypothetical protein